MGVSEVKDGHDWPGQVYLLNRMPDGRAGKGGPGFRRPGSGPGRNRSAAAQPAALAAASGPIPGPFQVGSESGPEGNSARNGNRPGRTEATAPQSGSGALEMPVAEVGSGRAS